MNVFTGGVRTNEIDFGDYVDIEQHRYGVPNEMYVHKVIGSFKSNVWVEVPIVHGKGPVNHDEVRKVVSVICCGIDENKVFAVLEEDCILRNETKNEEEQQMKFYEATTPYTALIKAKDIESAKEEYVKSVADDEGDLDLKEVAADYAIARYSLALSEEGKEVPLHEKLSDLRSDEQMVLIVEPDLA